MRRTRALVLAAVLCAAGTAPAFAIWDRLGSVNFSVRDTHDATYANVRADSMGLTARNSDVYCRSVMATFGNGRTREIYRGEIQRGNTVNVDLPGRDRNIERIDFDCRPTEGFRARVDVAANTDVRPAPEQFFNGMSRMFNRGY